MSDALDRSTALIERLLTEPSLRARFRSDPDGVLREHGLDELSAGQRALLTLELRESRSSLAGATFAAAADGLQAADLAAHAAPGWAHDAAAEISRLVHGGAHHAGPPSAAARAPLATADVPPLAQPPGAAPEAGTAPLQDATTGAEGAPGPAAPETGPGAGAAQAHASGPGPHSLTPARADATSSASAARGLDRTRAEHADAHESHADANGSHADAAALAAAGTAHPELPAYPGDAAASQALAHWMAAHATAAGLPAELPVMAALTESGLRNLPYGDRDSVGFFQMRTGIWDEGAYAGYPHRPALQLQWFIQQALAVGRTHPEYARDPSRWGEWVADVEQPAQAYRGRYQTQLEAAQSLLAGLELPAAGAPAADPGAAALRVAERYLGTPYDWGGAAPRTGFDCSGLVQYAFAQVGIHLPRVAADQFHAGVPVARDGLRPGDAVFFADPDGNVHHVGLYIGDGRFIDAPQTGEDVKIDSLSEPYFAAQYAGARRFGVGNAAGRGYARTLPALGG